jgi:hypothetical protein
MLSFALWQNAKSCSFFLFTFSAQLNLKKNGNFVSCCKKFLNPLGPTAPRIVWVTAAIYPGVIRPVCEAEHWPSSFTDVENECSYESAALICLKLLQGFYLLYFILRNLNLSMN